METKNEAEISKKEGETVGKIETMAEDLKSEVQKEAVPNIDLKTNLEAEMDKVAEELKNPENQEIKESPVQIISPDTSFSDEPKAENPVVGSPEPTTEEKVAEVVTSPENTIAPGATSLAGSVLGQTENGSTNLAKEEGELAGEVKTEEKAAEESKSGKTKWLIILIASLAIAIAVFLGIYFLKRDLLLGLLA